MVSVVTAPKMQPGFAVDDEIAGGAGIGDYCRNSQGRCLVAQRPAHKHLALKWEFAGGKVEPGESPEAALSRWPSFLHIPSMEGCPNDTNLGDCVGRADVGGL